MKNFVVLIFIFLGVFSFLLANIVSDILTLKSGALLYNKDHYEIVAPADTSYLELESISKKLQTAVIVSEDWAFYEHSGVDFNQLKIIFSEFLSSGKLSRGGSTITQQLMKNAFFSSKRTAWRKAKEIVYSLIAEELLTKEQILRHYLNMAHWGQKTYGIEAAASKYFKKEPNALTWCESIFLANILPSPERYATSFLAGQLSPFMKSQEDSLLHKIKIYSGRDQTIPDSCLAPQ